MIFRFYRGGVAFVCAVLALLLVISFPLNSAYIAFCFGVYALLSFLIPNLWIFCIPAAIPLLNFAPWSGWFFFDLLDALLLITLAIFVWHQKSDSLTTPLTDKQRLFLLVSIISLLISCFIGLWPFPPVDANSFANYFSHYNALRVGKGFFWGLVFALMLRRSIMLNPDKVLRFFVPGLLCGFSGVLFFILWERQVYSGLFNFDYDFRVTGPFSGMHIGGVGIDSFLAATFPWVMSCFVLSRRWWVKLTGIMLTGIGCYATFVTFSRIAYLSLFVSLLILCLGCFLQKSHIVSWRFGSILLIFIIVLIIFPITQGDFIQKRFSHAERDLNIRLSHWQDALAIRKKDLINQFWGMGLGSYIRINATTNDRNTIAESYRLVKESKNTFLRMSSSGSFFIDQRISLQPNQLYKLILDSRSDHRLNQLTVAVCEKSLLYSFRCNSTKTVTSNSLGQWEHLEYSFDSGSIGSGHFLYQRRPVVLSLFINNIGALIDIDNIRLLDTKGNDLLKNGDFSDNLDHWFFTVDDFLPWHISNLWVHLLFEQGFVGVVLFATLFIVVIIRCVKLVLLGDRVALLVLSSLGGIFTVGLIGTIVDFPRITILLFLILSLGCFLPGKSSYEH